MKNLKITYFLMALLALGIFSCSSDDEPGPDDQNTDPVNIEDDNAVSEALAFDNGEATVVEEATFPTASADAGAPSLLQQEDEKKVLAISGGKLALDIDEAMGAELKGAYVQIDGADHYYNIAFDNTNSNGRTFARRSRTAASARVQRVESLVITLPAGLEEGNFCLTYAVYDDQNRVSNSINVCVEVKRSGGENSGFLTDNDWAMVADYWTETYNGETYYDTTIVGQDWKENYEERIYCGDTGYKSFPAVHTYRLNYAYVSFSTDGTVTREQNEYVKEVDGEQSSCEEGLVYEEETDNYEDSGSWTYDADKKELTLVLTYTETSEETVMNPDGSEGPAETITETYTDTEIYQVSYENGVLTLTQEETDDFNADGVMETETETIIFEHKQ